MITCARRAPRRHGYDDDGRQGRRATGGGARPRADDDSRVRHLTIIGLFKAECIRTTVFHNGPYKTLADVEYATAGWVDWYNHARLHGSLGLVTPIEYEQAHYAAPQPVGSTT